MKAAPARDEDVESAVFGNVVVVDDVACRLRIGDVDSLSPRLASVAMAGVPERTTA